MEPQHPPVKLSYKTVLAVVATYLVPLLVLAYPLGFLTFMVQVWREHTYDAASAMYAASLMPASVVVAKSLAVLGSALFVIWGVSAFSAYTIASHRMVSVRKKDFEEELSGRRFTRWFMLNKTGRAAQLFMGFSLAAMLPYALLLVSLNDGTDLFYYSCAVLVAGVGSVVGALTLMGRPGEPPDKRTVYTRALPVMAGSVVLASLLLVPVFPTKLPVVRFSDGAVDGAALVSHADGYWYVVNDDAEVVAMPDDAVGTATISTPD